MKIRSLLLFGAAVALVCLPAAAIAQWGDDFDAYADGSSMHGQGGWKGWGNDPAATAYVTSVQSLSPPHSVEIAGASDLVHEYSGYDSGQWAFIANVYVPDDLVAPDDTYFILLNTYDDSGATCNWSTQVHFDPDTDSVIADFVGETLPILYNQWVELRVDIDLDADMQTVTYGGDVLYTDSWTERVSGGGALNIGAVDLFAYGASPVYYDSISLVPEPGSCLLLALAAALGLRRR
jgi:hypothetical protein